MRLIAFLAFALHFVMGSAAAQTTAGIATTVVFPVAAQTVSFASEMTLFNPGPNALTASVSFYEAKNSGAPGPKICNDVTVPAARSAQITLSTQCALTGSGGHFGLVVVADKAVPRVNAFYGYARVQNPQGIGFSVEGFPVTDFNNQVSHATGLKRKAAAPTYQTNCFVGSLDQPVSYQLKLFNDASGAQVGGTLTGSLTAFQQFRYLDVFGINGVNAPAGDLQNIRAQFTQTSGGNANLIGFCTLQDNTSFGADFRIAKSYGSPSDSFFAQGGNAFGTTAHLGTNDNQPLEFYANGQRVMRYVPGTNAPVASPNTVGGFANNNAGAFSSGQTIAGGGLAGSNCLDPTTNTNSRSCANQVANDFATVGGGYGNLASGPDSTIAGGDENTASGDIAVVGGGSRNLASGLWATVAGGDGNTANQELATVGGGDSNVAGFGATVAGGDGNTAGIYAAVAGGQHNMASGEVATVAGGSANTASGQWATVAGGSTNTASGAKSFAAGHNALADQTSCVVFGLWSGISSSQCLGTSNVFKVMGENGFSVDYHTPVGGGGDRWLAIGPFAHGVVPTTIITWNGAYLSDAGVWVNASSAKAGKTDLLPVDVDTVLKQLVRMPITTWRYKQGEGDVRHMGPMAEDFWQAFKIGYGDQTIADLDARGVEFAAIQGLDRLVQEKDATITAQEHQIEALEKRVADLESMHAEVTQLRAAMAALTHGTTSFAAALR